VSTLDARRHTREDLAERFAAIVGRDRAIVIDASPGVLLAVADLDPTHRVFLETAGSLLSEALQRLEEVGWAHTRNENLDLGLAWTAHELQAPIAGATMALGHVLSNGSGPEDRELLRRTKDELQRLSELIDPLLRWSAGSSQLRFQDVDLVGIVRDVVTSCRLESDEARLILETPDRLEIRADAQQLQSAIGNVVRNALAYSPPDAQVRIVIGSDGSAAYVSVRDRGPGVPAGERHLVFDPYARGSVGIGCRGGKGLGLFIARRIVEAHEGTIALRTVRSGAEFCIELPLMETGRTSSAS
jgi:signal transduction histidine kinase